MREILKMVRLIKGEISFRHAPMPEAFMRTSEKMSGAFQKFLYEAAIQMNKRAGKSFRTIYEQNFRQYLYGLSIKKSEKEKFLALGNILGYQNLEAQIKQLEFYEKELEYTLTELQKELPEKKKVVKSLGILGGILLAVLLW